MQHDWPGNVRELENTLEYAVTMTQRDIITDDLILQTQIAPSLAKPETTGSFKTLKEARSEFEKAYLIRILHSCNGKATRAASIAGKYRADFYGLLKKHAIKVAEFKRFN
jgi:two-component system, NtrC family, response regulator GlrR